MTAPDAPLLELESISKSFAGARVLKSISLTVQRGEFLTFLGPSGCGKTTTLRVVAGFERPDSGLVKLEGRDVVELPPYRRDVHTVFQHYALFPHYSVFDNVAFGLRVRRIPPEETARRVREALALVKLDGFERRRVTQLSGGQMQRIALARALVGRPSVLLLDEPLGALDLKLRKEMQLELKAIQRKLGITFIYVTHDQEEAMTMSDRIAVFNLGAIEQLGTPQEIYERPATSFVADFIGAANILSARIIDASVGRARIKLEDAVEVDLPPAASVPGPAGGVFKVAIRPERIAVRYRVESEVAGGAIRLKGALVENVYLGNGSQVFFQPFGPSGKTMMAVSLEAQHRVRREPGVPVWTDVKPHDILWLERVEGADPSVPALARS